MKRRHLFVIGQPFVDRIRKRFAGDEDVQHLCASHESLRVLLMEREQALTQAQQRLRDARKLASAWERELRASQKPAAPADGRTVVYDEAVDLSPCRRLYRAHGSCSCPADRCWAIDQRSRLKAGMPAVGFSEWLYGHRVKRREENGG